MQNENKDNQSKQFKRMLAYMGRGAAGILIYNAVTVGGFAGIVAMTNDNISVVPGAATFAFLLANMALASNEDGPLAAGNEIYDGIARGIARSRRFIRNKVNNIRNSNNIKTK